MTAHWLDRGVGLEERVDAVVADLAPDDLVAIALGDFAPLTARGLPVPSYVDSGTGLRDVPGATAFPAGIALAATFDPALAQEYGAAVGTQARAAGFTVVLGPTLDLARDPRGGRIPEALGEDPYLSGLLGAAHVRGLQGQHVIAQLKHFVAYNGESRRTGHGLEPDRGDAMDVRVSPALLHDVYLRPFEAAIRAGAWSMMGSYNRINGTYACESADVLAIPRRYWGWRGFYCPDFLFAVRDDAAALDAGLDLGALGGPGRRTPEMLASAPAGVLDSLVRNLVRALIGSGLADDPVTSPGGSTAPGGPSTPAHRELAERCAVAASVLLRNAGHALPFGDDARSLALIGPAGGDALFVVGGSAAVTLDARHVVTPRDGLAARLARAGDQGRLLLVEQGSYGDVPLPAVPAGVFSTPDGRPGVLVEYSDGEGATWSEVLPAIDHAVDAAAPARRWPGQWSAVLTPRASGRHRFSLELGGCATVRIDDEVVMAGCRELEQFLHGPHYPLQATVDLLAGVPVRLDVEYSPGPAISIPPLGAGPTLRLGWQEPDDLLARAVDAARSADAAVVLVTVASGEGMDRDGLALPGDQNELVRQVAAANPRTVVVLNTPGAVLMPWLEDVAAVLQVWYPGERYGAALAAMLFGDAEPGGRLPLTFPLAREHLPGGDHGADTVPTTLDYDADGGIGYRAPGVRAAGALFPFGFGLGYAATSCVPSGWEVADGRVRIRLRATNSGERRTVHVAQLYATIGGAAPELAAVARVGVPPNGSEETVVDVGADAFARWDHAAARRLPVAGEHTLWLGTNAADLAEPLTVVVDASGVVAVRR